MEGIDSTSGTPIGETVRPVASGGASIADLVAAGMAAGIGGGAAIRRGAETGWCRLRLVDQLRLRARLLAKSRGGDPSRSSPGAELGRWRQREPGIHHDLAELKLLIFVAEKRDRPTVVRRLSRSARFGQLAEPSRAAPAVLTHQLLVECAARLPSNGRKDRLEAVVIVGMEVHLERCGDHGRVEQLFLVGAHVLDDVEDDVLACGAFRSVHQGYYVQIRCSNATGSTTESSQSTPQAQRRS